MSAPDALVAEVVRNGYVESRHYGRVVALAADGTRLLEVGDVDAPMFARSSLKPLQTMAMLAAGWSPNDEEYVAIAAASHSGSPRHVDVVRRLLASVGLDESALDNTPDPDHLQQNCSGKHAAMLATCVANGWPTDGYRDPSHPLQQSIRTSIEAMCDETASAVAIDGCGAPLFAFSLVAVARGFAHVVSSRVGVAMRTHPDLVGGEGRDVTELMRRVPGLVAKDGAEGVYAAVRSDGAAVAVKIADGAARARVPVLLHALGVAGLDVAGLDDLVPTVLGHGEIVGLVRAAVGPSEGISTHLA